MSNIENFITGTEEDKLFYLSLSAAAAHSNAVHIDNITDISITQTSNPSTYNTITDNDAFQFPTSKMVTITGTMLVDKAGYDSDLRSWYDHKTCVYARASLEGNASGTAYKERRAFVTQFDLAKNGTNVYERSFTLTITGPTTDGNW